LGPALISSGAVAIQTESTRIMPRGHVRMQHTPC
jgi:hypothetical protein